MPKYVIAWLLSILAMTRITWVGLKVRIMYLQKQSIKDTVRLCLWLVEMRPMTTCS